MYHKTLVELLEACDKKTNFFLWQPGDVCCSTDDYVLSKIRCLGNKKTTILKCLEERRHWGFIYHPPKDIPFKEKEDKIIWRGATTGRNKNPANRFLLITKYFNKNLDIDVGFKNPVDRKDCRNYEKSRMTPEEMLKYKYILSIEGNDKDSGLNWKLNSNSLVLMAKPTKFSWLMEDRLVPGYHYVLLKDNFSDLEKKLKWCRENQDKCKKIINNANSYMQQFMDIKREDEIEQEVINRYFNKMNILGKDFR